MILIALAASIFFRGVSSFSSGHSKIIPRNLHRDNGRRFIHDLSTKTSEVEEDRVVNIEPYVGPIGSFGDMEGGVAIENIGCEVLVGPSLVVPGERGLFLSILEDVEEVILPQGTPICGYSRGYFTEQSSGDKSVEFSFTNAEDTAIFYEKELMSLANAIRKVHTCEEFICRSEKTDVPLLLGHTISIDKETKAVTISPDQNFTSRAFIPSMEENESEFSPTRLGIFANDLAFDPDADEDTYNSVSEMNNVLQIAWRIAMSDCGTLIPTWLVVIVNQDVRFVNTAPMEIGLKYGHKYWRAYLDSHKDD